MFFLVKKRGEHLRGMFAVVQHGRALLFVKILIGLQGCTVIGNILRHTVLEGGPKIEILLNMSVKNTRLFGTETLE